MAREKTIKVSYDEHEELQRLKKIILGINPEKLPLYYCVRCNGEMRGFSDLDLITSCGICGKPQKGYWIFTRKSKEYQWKKRVTMGVLARVGAVVLLGMMEKWKRGEHP